MHLLTGFFASDLSFAVAPPLSLLPFFYFLPPYFSGILATAPLRTDLLVVVPAIFPLVVLATVFQPSLGSSLKLDVQPTIFGTWCTGV